MTASRCSTPSTTTCGRLWTGQARLAPVAGLAPLRRRARRSRSRPLLDLIEANRVDQHVGRYETFDDLLGYCRLSAAPIGRLVLHIADAATERNIADSDAVCAALQVLEHCQDVGEDARAGRVYLPAADLRAAGVADGRPDRRDDEPAAARRRRPAGRARAGAAAGRAAAWCAGCRGWARLAVAGYVAGGLATADALRARRLRRAGARDPPGQGRDRAARGAPARSGR